MKKLFAVLLACIMTFSAVACLADEIHLEYAVNFQIDDQVTVMQELIDLFYAETGIKVELTPYGVDFESIMKTRMGSKQLPDLWNTHGWSVMRYGEYLETLNDQDWVQYIDDSIKGAIQDKTNGNIYILPISEGVNAIMYNKTVLQENGIDPTAIKDIPAFEAAMDTLVAAGITPMYISNGGSMTNNGHFMDAYLPAFLTCASLEKNYGEELKEGTFDWANARPAFEKMAEWWKKGYWNVDASTADRDTCFRALANGECAFMFYTNDGINAVLDLNPDAQIGMIPMPAVDVGGLTTWGVSEGNNSCIGIWKDSPNKEAAKQFLSFLARPENAARVLIEIEGGIPAMTNVNVDGSYSIDAIREGQAAFAGCVDYVTYFDQAYLPSGMFWELMQASSAFFEGEGGTEENIDNAIKLIEDTYKDAF